MSQGPGRGRSTEVEIVGFHQGCVHGRWSLDVVVRGVLFGRILRGDDASYCYFEGSCNEITWSFADCDLERLKTRIRATLR